MKGLVNKINSGSDFSIVFLSSVVKIPKELEKFITISEAEYMEYDEIRKTIVDFIEYQELPKVADKLLDELAMAFKGLTRFEINNLLALAYSDDGELTRKDLNIIFEQKKQMIMKSGILEMINVKESIDDIGGLENLKEWFNKKAKVIKNINAANKFGVAMPKGVLIAGVPGCGKSLNAKAAAALFEVMRTISQTGADFIYTDELTFSKKLRNVISAHFKPDFAPDNLRANNYICHFSVFSRQILKEAGPFRGAYDGSQDHDFILRATEKAKNIAHIPEVLYYWRSHPSSVAWDINSKLYAVDAGKRAVSDHIRRMGMSAKVESSIAFPTIYRIGYDLTAFPLVSIVIPNKDHYEDISRCVDSILGSSTYPNFEVVIIDNGSSDPNVLDYYKSLKEKETAAKISVLSWPHNFNYAAINNFGVQFASGEQLVLLNSDTKIISPNWIEEMLMYAQRPDVGAVGAKLYYADDTIQHAGIILGLGSDRVAEHAFHKADKQNTGYMGRLYYAQNYNRRFG